MYNKVIMMGRIANDPELKTTPQGVNVCSLRMAVDRRFQPKDGEKQVDFFNVVAWRQAGEFVAKYFSKGRMILVEGELQTRQYTDKNGAQATWYEINAERVSFTGEAKQQGGDAYADTYNAPAAPASASAQAAPASNAAFSTSDADDDYPF